MDDPQFLARPTRVVEVTVYQHTGERLMSFADEAGVDAHWDSESEVPWISVLDGDRSKRTFCGFPFVVVEKSAVRTV